MIPVRQKVDRIPEPHRLSVIAAGPGQRLCRIVGEIHQANRMGAAAAIVTPLASLVLGPRWEHRERDLFVGKAAAVRRKCAGISTWRRQRLSHTTPDVDAPEPEVRMGYGIAVGSKDHSATSRSPSADDVQTRMISQAPGLASCRGNHIDIRVARYSAGVGYK